MALAPIKLILHSTPHSLFSARIRIACLLKGLSFSEYELTPKNNQTLTPNAAVPTVHATYPNGQSLTITQSLSMLSFLEESFPGPLRLLPPITDMRARMQVRDLAALVACDIQPLQNSNVRRELKKQGQSSTEWAKGMLRRGIAAYEVSAVKSAGKFSVRDELSWADVCLYPMLQEAQQLPWEPGELLGASPTVSRIMEVLGTIDAFQSGGL